MSEHTKLTCNKIEYIHIPYRKEGFSYCRHCKRFVTKASIQLNEGWFTDWMQVNCGHCGKAIWVCSFKNPEIIEKLHKKQKRGKDDEKDNDGIRIFVKDDKKCFICKKPTNHYDCYCSIYGGKVKPKVTKYICSEKCDKIYDKRFRK